MHCVVANSRMQALYPVSGHLAKPGAKLEDMLRYGAENGEYPGVEGPEAVDAFVRLWMSCFASGEAFVGESELAGERWLMVSHHPTASGGYVSIRADITAQKQRETELQEAKDDLEARSGELMLLAERAAGGAPRRRHGQSQQVAVPRQHGARTAHAAQCHQRLLGADPQRGVRPDATHQIQRICRVHRPGRRASAVADQRHPRSVEDRSRQDGAAHRGGADRPGRVSGGRIHSQDGDRPERGAALRRRQRLPDPARRSARRAPDPAQPAVQRGQVHAGDRLRHHRASRATAATASTSRSPTPASA